MWRQIGLIASNPRSVQLENVISESILIQFFDLFFIKFRWTCDNVFETVVKHNAEVIHSTEENYWAQERTWQNVFLMYALYSPWKLISFTMWRKIFFLIKRGIEKKRSPCSSLSQFHIFKNRLAPFFVSFSLKFQHSMETHSNLCIYRIVGIIPNHQQWFKGKKSKKRSTVAMSILLSY